MNNIDRYIAERMVAHRRAVGITQVELATILGVSRTTVNNMEHARQSFTTKSLFLLTRSLDIHISEIFPAPGDINTLENDRNYCVHNPRPDNDVV